MPAATPVRRYSSSETEDYLSRGGDVLAAMLGRVVAAVRDDDRDKLDGIVPHALDSILEWHLLRAEVFSRCQKVAVSST